MRTRIDIGRFLCGFECGHFMLEWSGYGVQAYRAKSFLWPSWTRGKHYGVRLFGIRWLLCLGELSDGVLIGRRDEPRLRARFYSSTERDVWPDVITDSKPIPETALQK